MSKKIFTVAILGCGGRGAETYGRLIAERKDEYKRRTFRRRSRESLFGRRLVFCEKARRLIDYRHVRRRSCMAMQGGPAFGL